MPPFDTWGRQDHAHRDQRLGGPEELNDHIVDRLRMHEINGEGMDEDEAFERARLMSEQPSGHDDDGPKNETHGDD